ncbi:DUF1576 domain-containing protein [[Clostridium] aminophilum]|uniref:DUF1576 domain-containing protein n=1 Tax=[Clostridium] aminophilum TaxID=1526 RepID=A0A1I6JWS5_9FIRM|nr:DUF1576 domain-containing protein [[Clostridium] aminophilum]SFR83449.1 Protein of unknown function [[Clostridium] aminophilum]
MDEKRKITRRQRYSILSLIPVYFMTIGVLIDPPWRILNGMLRIVTEPDFLITDYIKIGGIGAAFLNAGLLMLMSIWLCYYLGLSEDGHTITSSCQMFGFSLFGKNLINIWAILLGVFLYSYYHKTHMSRYIYIGLYGTSLSPIITQIMYTVDLPYTPRFLLSVSVGIIIGFILPPLATSVHYAHQGYSLYNVGFAAGIVATVVVSVFKSFGINTHSRLIWSYGHNRLLFGVLAILFLGMILVALIDGGDLVIDKYRKVLKTTGMGGTDFLKNEGGSLVMLNMGINGLFATAAVIMVGGELNGPTIGGIFTIVGFSATGKHLRNIVPVMFGVWLSSVSGFWSADSPAALLAFLFSTTLAPIAGAFGVIPGIIAGFLHAAVAMQIGSLYDGMNLYNNGFAGGIVAIFMVPVIQSIRDRRARARGGISL